MTTFLVKNTQFVDGTGFFLEKTDVFVTRGKISAIGNLKLKTADVVIDGKDLVFYPGFLDFHSELDHYGSIFRDSTLPHLLSQGITTAVLGHGGVSLAPLRDGVHDLFGTWGYLRGVNASWHTFSEFVSLFSKKTWGVNLVSLVGLGNLVDFVATKSKKRERLEMFMSLLHRSISQGAIGISWHENFEDKLDISNKERVAVAQELVRSNKILTFTPSSLDTDGEWNVWNEISIKTGLKIVYSDFNFASVKTGGVKEIFNALAPNAWIETSPFVGNPEPIARLLPGWATGENISSILKSAWRRKKVLSDMNPLDIKETWVVYAPGHDYLVGKNIDQISNDLGISGEEAILRIMELTCFGASILRPQLPREILEELVCHERCLVGSHSFTPTENVFYGKSSPTIHSLGSTREIIELASRVSEKVFIATVARMSSVPAKVLNIPLRGSFVPGYIADMVGFGSDGQPAITIINGRIAWSSSEIQEGCFGEFIT